MAKQAVGPVIRYLDKAVLGLCGVVFLYFLAMYGVMSPNKAGAEGSKLGPGEVDVAIRREAETLRERLLTAPPPKIDDPSNPPFQIPDLAGIDDVLAFADVPPRTRSPVPPGPPVAERSGVAERPTVDLVDTIALGKPGTTHGRSGVYLAPPEEFKGGESGSGARSDTNLLQDANWVTVYASFDRATQEQLFREAGYAYTMPIVLGVDLQRRSQIPGGWTEWITVQPASRMKSPTIRPPAIEPTARGVYAVDAKDREEIDGFAELITTGQNNEAQCDLLRPLFLHTEYGDPWLLPQTHANEILQMDAEFQAVPRCRYPECEQADDQIDTTADYDELYKEAERALADQRFDAAMRFAEAARDKAQSATGPTRDRDVRKAEDLVQRIQIDKARAEQALTARQALPIQIAWAHDASELRSGRTYQYQARLRLFNPYCGQPTLLNDPMQARIVEQAGPWSEPSDAVTIAPDTLVFMRSDRPANLEVRLEVFKWYAGEWLMRPFAVTIGDAIGEPRPAKTPRGDGKVTVDFGTGSTVVDIDFGHRTLVPDRRTGRLEPATTTALTYVDASGNLRQNLLALDKASETYGQLKGLVWKE